MKRRTLACCIALVVLCATAYGQKKPAESEVAKTTKAAAKEKKTDAKPFKDEPAAHALYNKMIEAMRKADSLSFVCKNEVRGKNDVPYVNIYRAWLKKPNYFRVEGFQREKKKPDEGTGVLIGDGENLWTYWPKGRPRFYGAAGPTENDDVYEKTRMSSYMTKPAPPGGHSILHEASPIGAGLMILDLSTFHGYTDCLQEYLDGVRSLPAEKVSGVDCDGIEVSIMKHQRSWYLWLSKTDHLPRKIKEIVRVSYDLVIEEQWSEVAVNAVLPDKMFAWKPPKGWKEWHFPDSEAKMLKPGTQGPDFQLTLTDGRQIHLSDFRGQVVWFYIWRAG
jgi:outer membrane lipoprotein-sorting protein